MEYSGHLSALAISNEKARSGSLQPRLGEAVGLTYRFCASEMLERRRNGTQPPKKYNNDRFIHDRSSMDMAIAYKLLTDNENNREAESSPSKLAYRRALRDSLLDQRGRILTFASLPPAPRDALYRSSIKDQLRPPPPRPKTRNRHIPQTAERTLDAPELLDDYYLNLLDWGSRNVLAVALGSSVYLWDADTCSTSELLTVDEDDVGPVTSVSWSGDGRHLAVGLNDATVQLWDSTSTRLVRTMKGAHQSRIGAMSWNGQILTSGGMDGQIFNHDVRIRSPVIQTYKGHTQEVCGLKWADNGRQLASGGNDNLLHIWDVAAAAPPLHRLDDHKAAVKALAWCPFQSNVLASGGGGSDRSIKFWHTQTGACLNSVDTGSQVCSLQWNRNERELLSSHGFMQNQLTLWKYPSMAKVTELTGHTSRVLFTAVSPDGCTVVSAAGDETLRFWNVFGETTKKKKKGDGKEVGFARYHIR